MEGEWERVLWKKQGHPDNFMGYSFIGVDKKCFKVSFGHAVYGAILVLHQICSCFGLVGIFWGLNERQLDPMTLLMALGSVTSICYILFHAQRIYMQSEGIIPMMIVCIDELKLALITSVLVFCSSPVIKTLTESVSTDTIHACTAVLLFMRLVFHPYGVNVAIVNPTMSDSLGIFASICLASRLEHQTEVFALVMTAVCLFILWSRFSDQCRNISGAKIYWILCPLTLTTTHLCLILYVPSLCSLMLIVVIIIGLIAPSLFIFLQPRRQNIYGPWDEALIRPKSDVPS